jgi:hypothetical protein
MKNPITSRSDLSFTGCDADGVHIDWQPARAQGGYDFLTELEKLADVDEFEAYTAIKHALLSSSWRTDGNEEAGFTDAIVRAAIIGMRAMREKEDLPFETVFNPEHSQRCSMQVRLELAELQLGRLRQRPWRTYEEAGFK